MDILRINVRRLVRSPLFTVIAVLTLAVGIGATTAIFSVVNGVLLEPLPYPESARLVYVGLEAPGLGYDQVPFSDAFYTLVRDNGTAFAGVASYSQERVHLTGEGTPEELPAARVTPGFFSTLRVVPQLGRAFTRDDAVPGAEPVAVIGHGLWQRRFGGDPTTIGRTVRMDGVDRRVVGIAPAGFAYPTQRTSIWRPLEIDEANLNVGNFSYPSLGRLADGVAVEAARADIDRIIAMIAEAWPEEIPPGLMEQARFGPVVTPLKKLIVGDVTRPLWVVLGTVGLVLLIACANVANLFLVRAESRGREVAVRSAMGAGRGRLARFFLTESVSLALVGGAVGIALARGGIAWLTALAPASIPRLHEIGMDPVVLLFTLAVSVLAGLVFGAFPVLRFDGLDLVTALKEGRTTTSGRRRHRTRNALVVVQVALALVLLVGSGLMVRSFQALRSVEPGFEAEGVLTFQLALPDAEYDDGARQRFYRQLQDRLAGMPGVASVGITSGLPLTEAREGGSLHIEGREQDESTLPPLADRRRVSAGYPETMRIPLREGRAFEPGDGVGTGFPAAIVSRSFAEHYFPGESALGHRIRTGEWADWLEIVGVVEDVHGRSLEEEPGDVVYLPLRAGSTDNPYVPGNVAFAIRTAGSPRALMSAVRDQVWSLDPNIPVVEPRTMTEILDDSLSRTSFTMLMLGIAAAVALLLGMVGIYGVVAYVAGQRTHEIGIRMALGSSAGAVRGMVVRQGIVLAVVGIAIGLLVALGLSTVMDALLFRVAATDPLTYALVGLVLLGVALLASYIPARRAAAVDPSEALRAE